MARPLTATTGSTRDRPDRRLARSTARAFAAAISALFISTLVIDRSSDALEHNGAVSGTAVESGILAIEDDDAGRSLFDLSGMAPGRPEERCIEIRYTGTIVPVELILLAETSGDLAPFLMMSVEEGRGGSFESCDGFLPTGEVFAGTLAELAVPGGLSLGSIRSTDERRAYRVTFELADQQAALGRSSTLDLVWEVSP